MKKSRGIYLLLILASVSGCSFGFKVSADTKQYFVFDDIGAVTSEVAKNDTEASVNDALQQSKPERVPLVLRVRRTMASRFIDSQRILFSEESSTRGYYQFAEWVETPPNRFTVLLETRLDQMELFNSVVSDTSGVSAGLQLNTEIEEFYHDTSDDPGEVTVRVRAELINLTTREVIARRTWEARAPASSFDAFGAVQGFEQAVKEILDRITAWIGPKSLRAMS